MTRSVYTSAKSMSAAVPGGWTKPSLSWMVPVGGVDVRVETTLRDIGCSDIDMQGARNRRKRSTSADGREGGGGTGTHSIIGIVEGEGASIAKPVLERKRDLAEVVLPEHVLVPDDELDGAELVGEREVDGKVERGLIGVVDRVESAFERGGLLPFA